MKNLFECLAKYKKESVLGPSFKLLEALFELYVPIVVKNIIDFGVSAGDKNYIVTNFLLLVMLSVVGIVCSLTAQYFSAKAAVGATSDFRARLFAHIQTLSFRDMDKIGTATLITRLTGDMNQVQNGINLALRLLLRSPFVVLGAVVMAATIDVQIALIMLAVVLVLAVIVFAIMLASIPLQKKVQSKLDSITSLTLESLTGVRVIRAFGMSEKQLEKFKNSNNDLNGFQRFAGKITAIMNPATTLVLNIGIVLLLNASGAKVNDGVLTTGEVVALYNYITQILVELVKFANLVLSIIKFVACTKRVEQILAVKPSMTYPECDPTEPDDANSIEFRNVTIRYNDSSEPVLEGVSFTAKRGETLGIIGGTGSGKTSLVNHLCRLYDVAEGEVLVNGCDVRDYPAKTLRHKFGYVLQNAKLFKGSIKDNLLWGDTEADIDALSSAINYAQAKTVVDAKSDGIDSHVEQNGRNLSGGQRQRLTIARALVRRPEILILDDSSSALDFRTDADLRAAIKALDYDPTTVIISQRTSSIMHADKIIVLDEGRVVGIGTHRELLDTCSVYREIYESQYAVGGVK